MAELDLNAPFGNTSPVVRCGDYYNVPAEVALNIADALLHGRRGYWVTRAYQWLADDRDAKMADGFIQVLSRVTDRAR